MKIVVRCSCGQKLAVKTSRPDKQFRCPKCDMELKVPRASTSNEVANGSSGTAAVPAQNSEESFSVLPDSELDPVSDSMAGTGHAVHSNAPLFDTANKDLPTASAYPLAIPIAPIVVQPVSKKGHADSRHELESNPQLLPKRGIIAGVEAMVFGIVHFGVTAFAIMAWKQLRSMQQMHPAFDNQAKPLINIEAGISGFFTNSQISVLLFAFFMTGLCVAGVLGAIGLFRHRLWGWITVLVTAALSIAIAVFLGYQYFSVLNAWFATHAAMFEHMDERAMQAYRSIRRQIHLTYWLLFVCYLGYAISVGRMLFSNGVLDAYRIGSHPSRRQRHAG